MHQKLATDSFIEREVSRKRFVLTLTLLILAPAIGVFAVINYNEDRILVTVMDAVLSCLLFINLYLIRKQVLMLLALRITTVVTLLIMGHLLMTGVNGGLSMVWYYVLPPAVFFLYGIREGLLWVGISFLILVSAFFVFNFFPYKPVDSFRYLISYSVISALAFGLESARTHFAEQLYTEKSELQKALDEVKTLKGFIPICANCKKIRNDDGFWEQLELFIHNNSDAEFSHSICPDCAEDLYGDLLTE